MQNVIRSSEFWVALAAGVGQMGAMFGWWSQEHFDKVLYPAIVYIVSRVTSKAVKAAVPSQ